MQRLRKGLPLHEPLLRLRHATLHAPIQVLVEPPQGLLLRHGHHVAVGDGQAQQAADGHQHGLVQALLHRGDGDVEARRHDTRLKDAAHNALVGGAHELREPRHDLQHCHDVPRRVRHGHGPDLALPDVGVEAAAP